MLAIILITFAFCGLICSIYLYAEYGSAIKSLVHKPWVYSLSLGGFAGIWALFGTLQLAENNGFMYLSYFLGTSSVFILAPLLLHPLASLSQTYHLHSLADLLSFRYNSQLAGIIVTVGSLLGVLPLVSMQLLTLGNASRLLFFNSIPPSYIVNLTVIVTCICIAIFTLINLRRHTDTSSQHQGLIFTVAILSIFKLCVFLGVAIYCTYAIFGSFPQLEHWLYIQPDKLMLLNESQQSNHTRSLTLIFFSATLAMPHMFLLTFNERATPQAIKQSSWLFPSYLLLLSLPILPFVWMKEYTQLDITAELIPFALGHILQNPTITILMYLAALAAITSSISIICLSISGMLSSHIVLPLILRSKRYQINDNLQPLQGMIISTILVIAAVTALAAGDLNNLNQFGFASYTAILQFLPSILAVIYWSKANRRGLHLSLFVGLSCWFITTALPLISEDAWGLKPWLQQFFFFDNENYWFLAAISSLGLNMLTLGFASVLSSSSESQRHIAKVCAQNEIGKPIKRHLLVENTDQIITNLSKELGGELAKEQVTSALSALNMRPQEQRPFALRLLRRQLESNLSAIYGPIVARRIVALHLPYAKKSASNLEDQQIIEYRLEKAKHNLSGLAGELDGMRRQHQKTIEQLPIGVFTFSSDHEIIIWNSSLAHITQINSDIATGLTINKLPEPWCSLFEKFIASDQDHIFKKEVSINNNSLWFNLHKGDNDEDNIRAILLEDVSQLTQLENEWLHHERLATIGRLAAGVAHEIGNPVTGIACLAQNLKYDSDNPDVDASAKDILIQTERITKIVQSLVNFSHAGSHGESKQLLLEPINLQQCVNEAIDLLALKDRNILSMVNNELPKYLNINGNAQGLQQVFINLIQNSAQACYKTDHARITISAKTDEFSINLSVRDNGPGIPIELQDKIFEPFVTTKGAEEGTGLGLAIVYNIIEEHHGHIHAISPPYQQYTGCEFLIKLPLDQTATESHLLDA